MTAIRVALVLAVSACTKSADTDTGVPDTDDTDVADTDGDTADTDGDTADTDGDTDTDTGPACDDYEPWFDLVVDCDGTWTQLWKFVSLSHPYDGVCDPYYGTFDGQSWATPAEAFTALGCDDTCVYEPAQAVMVLYCGVRGEYIDYATGGDGQLGDGAACGTLIHGTTCAGTGYATDWYAYQAAFPCEPDDTCPPE